jgi:hypothetical protein
MNLFKTSITLFCITLFSHFTLAQSVTLKDSLQIIKKDPQKGFQHDYILFIPKGTPLKKMIYLLIEPNNTGILSDSIEVHQKHAISLASISSVGNNISTELKIPLLVPIFPRPASKPLVYTHALDRETILEKEELERLDLQLIAMKKDALKRLNNSGFLMHDKVFMNGFSASGSFTNRFVMLHPEMIKAAAMGGLNGELILPLPAYKNENLNYPVGINDIAQITKTAFNPVSYKSVPQFIYMGALDENDAVQFDDAYSLEERNQINTLLGNKVQERWKQVQKIYLEEKVNSRFRTYEDVGHWTTSKVNLDVILFFNTFLQE